MLELFSVRAVEFLKRAKTMSEEENKSFATTKHLLMSLFESSDTICHFLLEEKGITLNMIKKEEESIESRDEHSNYSKEFVNVVKTSELFVEKINQNKVYDEHIFFAILENYKNDACNILKKLGFELSDLIFDITDIFGFYEIENKEKTNKKELWYLSDLKKSCEKDKPYIDKDNNLKKIEYILGKAGKHNVILVGHSGVGKSALVYALAKRTTKNIYELDLGGVIAGSKYRGVAEEKLINALNYCKNNNAILFLDEIHNIVGAGSNEGSLDIANILKPYLTKGEISFIGATTFEEYEKYIKNDAALTRRFQKIIINEPSLSDVLIIIDRINIYYEHHYKIKLTRKEINMIIKYSSFVFTNSHYPDKAIDLMDNILSRMHINKQSFNKELKNFLIDEFKIPYNYEKRLVKTNINYKEILQFYNDMFKNPNRVNIGVYKSKYKIEKSKLYDDLLFCLNISSNEILEIDTNIYTNEIDISNLIGSPKGYIGFEKGGLLSNYIRTHILPIIYITNYYDNSELAKFINNITKNRIYIDSLNREINFINTLFIIEYKETTKRIGYL